MISGLMTSIPAPPPTTLPLLMSSLGFFGFFGFFGFMG